MPPPVPSESELESDDYWSDSESVHSIDNAPPEAKREETSDGIADLDFPAPRISESDSSPQYTDHSTAAQVNNGKRKAESESDDNSHVAKLRRTDFSGFDFAESDDDEVLPDTAYLQQSFSAYPAPVVNGATADSASHSSLKTTLTLFQEMYPHLPPPVERPGNLFTHLASLPAVRTPVASHRFNDVKPQNIPAFLMQAAGDLVPREKACERCTRQAGILKEACVVVRDRGVLEVTGGSCANCWYARQGSTCTFRQGAATTVPQRRATKESSPVPAPQTCRREPNPAPVPASAAPIHPSYAAALATGAVTAAPAPAPANSSATSGNLSRDGKVRVWENQYGSMDMDNLLRAHEHLEEWQEDLTTRLMAMNRVVLAKLMEREL